MWHTSNIKCLWQQMVLDQEISGVLNMSQTVSKVVISAPQEGAPLNLTLQVETS